MLYLVSSLRFYVVGTSPSLLPSSLSSYLHPTGSACQQVTVLCILSAAAKLASYDIVITRECLFADSAPTHTYTTQSHIAWVHLFACLPVCLSDSIVCLVAPLSVCGVGSV